MRTNEQLQDTIKRMTEAARMVHETSTAVARAESAVESEPASRTLPLSTPPSSTQR